MGDIKADESSSLSLRCQAQFSGALAQVWVKDTILTDKTICIKLEQIGTDNELLKSTLQALCLPADFKAQLLLGGKSLTKDSLGDLRNLHLTLATTGLIGGASPTKGEAVQINTKLGVTKL